MWRGNWRDENWSALGQRWDMVVVGGGIVGAGVFREATSRGLRVLLVEQRDFAWGTSSRSSKMVHGGLRYLKDGGLRVTWESVHERKRLMHEGRGLIQSLGFLLMRFNGDKPPLWVYKAGLSLYDLMGGHWQHRRYSAEQMKLLVPRIADRGLGDGFGYAEAQTDDARLTLRVLSEGMAAGGVALNYVQAESLLRERGQAVGVQLRDRIGNRVAQVPARLVVNATGAWTDHLRSQNPDDEMMRPLRGSHLVFAAWRFPVAQAVSINHPLDQRPVTIEPWEGVTLVGTTDVDHVGSLDEEPCISPDEVSYLMAAADYAFPSLGLGLQDVIASFAGVRPVINTGKADPSKEARDHVIMLENGLLTVTGGKLTTFHLMALDALRAIPRTLLSVPPQRAPFALDPVRVEVSVSEPLRSRLLGRYGNCADRLVASARQSELDLIPGTNAAWAEVRWSAGNEAVMHLDDLLLRRVRLGILLPCGASALLPQIRAICQPELGWDDARWEAEQAAYCALWERCYSLPDNALIPDWRQRIADVRRAKAL